MNLEPIDGLGEPAGAPSPNQKCTICGVVLPAEQPPARCPECGARGAMFRPTGDPPRSIAHSPLLPRDASELGGEVLGPHAGGGCLGRD